jgi:hypothetical protein
MTSERKKIREKDLYGLISKELEGNRSTCYTVTVEEYPFSIDKKKGRRIDVAAAKWSRESNLEVAAVECKRGQGWKSIENAIGQAVTYQTFFPFVYVATQTPEEGLGHMENVLRSLGLGYIHVGMKSRESGKARIVFRPEKSNIIEESRTMNQVLHPLGHLLVWKEYWGEVPIRYGAGDEQSRFWVGAYPDPIGLKARCNYVTQFHPTGSIVQGVNFESQTYLRKFFRNANKTELLDVLRSLPQDAIMIKHHFELLRNGKTKTQASKPCERKETSLSEVDASAVRSLFRYAEEKQHAIWLLIALESEISRKNPVRS